MGDGTAVERAFAAAAHLVELTLDNHRIVINPMEPRGGIGQYDHATGRYTLHVSSQNIHGIRDAVARALGVAPTAVRLVAPDVGGGFGAGTSDCMATSCYDRGVEVLAPGRDIL